MTIAETCDVAYALLAEDVRARALADRQIMGFAIVMGEKVEMPDVDDALARLDEFLESDTPRRQLTPGQAALRELLGLPA